MLYKDDRIGIFIDGPNFYSSCKMLGFTPDYSALKTFFSQQGKLKASVYAAALLTDGSEDPMIRLTDFLTYNGWRVLSKPAKSLAAADGSRRIKGNMDLELAIEMISATSYLDHIILFSGDGDFKCVVRHLQERGVQVTAVSNKSQCADELRRQVDEFIDLQMIMPLITRAAPPANDQEAA